MNKTEEKSLQELQKDLVDIQTGFEILKIRKSQIEMEVAHKENNEEKVRALVMQSSHLLEAQQEDSLEEQDWEAEQENIEEDMIMEMAREIK